MELIIIFEIIILFCVCVAFGWWRIKSTIEIKSALMEIANQLSIANNRPISIICVKEFIRRNK